jgi:hypothetical protein
MPESKLIISPKTKIGELLEAYPQLEEVLIEMSPVFAKLKNPVLRRTVAKVATIQQISVVGGIPLNDIINRLRKETGQLASGEEAISTDSVNSAPPEWYDEKKIADRFDATPVINAGGSPMAEVLRKAQALNTGEIFELQTPFIPAPIIDMLKGKGFGVHSVQKGDTFLNYISKP